MKKKAKKQKNPAHKKYSKTKPKKLIHKPIVKISKFNINMPLVKEYIKFKSMHKSVLNEKNAQKKQEIMSAYFSNEEYEDFKNNGAFPVWEANFVKRIIKACIKNEIQIDEIQQIPDYISHKTEILKSVSDHFVQQEMNKTLEIKTTNESTFRKLCLQYFEDGVLFPDEEEDLYLERDILGIDKEYAEEIIESTREEFEIAKPKDYILEILNKGPQTESEIEKTLNAKPYMIKINAGDINHIIESRLNHQVIFEKKTKKYSLVDNVTAVNNEKSKSVQYGQIKYTYSFKEVDKHYDYVMANSNPSDQSCSLTINVNNVFFEDIEPKEALAEVVCDGIMSHRLSTLDYRDQSIDFSKQALKLKAHIRKKIKNQL